MRKLGRAMGLTVIAAMTAIVGCSAIFGLDPPTRRAEDASAPDATMDATTTDVVVGDEHRDAEASLDESVDASDGDEAEAGDGSADAGDASDGDSAPIGVRCGFPDAQLLCTGNIPCCIATPGGTGTTYSCAEGDAACAMAGGHYVFKCTVPSDCPGSHCCHYNLHAVCDTNKCTSSSNDICDPNADGGCRGTLTCGPLSINGALTPYFGCQ
jgi:hypothetical protein